MQASPQSNFKLQHFLVNMHIRFSLAEAVETLEALHPDVDVALPAESYSTPLLATWSAFLLSFLDVRPEKVFPQQSSTEQAWMVHYIGQAEAAASSALSPEALMATQAEQHFNGPGQVPTMSDAQATAKALFGRGLPRCSTVTLQIVALHESR